MGSFILSIDQSTSATKAVLFDESGTAVNRVSLPHEQYYPQTGFVEHDAEEIYANTLEVMKRCVSESPAGESDLSAVAITNQRETVLVWDRATGRPVANAAVWQCLRGEPLCNRLKRKGHAELVKEKTGLLLDPYFSASKLAWIFDNVSGARARAESGGLMFGTIDSWLVWKLTGGSAHVTDYSNACRTLLLDINELDWSPELFDLFSIPLDMAPSLVYADTIVGTTVRGKPFDCEVHIAGILGDSHAALFGENCFEAGSVKATYGTGTSIMMNTGPTPTQSNLGIVTSVGFALESGVTYAFEGNIHSSGATIQWLAEDAGLIERPSESEVLARSVPSTEGVYLVPAFVGLGAPYWDSDARALITGMSRSTKKAHIVRAAEESIAYQIRDLLQVMGDEASAEVSELRADGGATRDAFLMQFQADILDIPVQCAPYAEVSALGSAYAAGLATGVWKNVEDLESLGGKGKRYEPAMEPSVRESLLDGWRTAVGRTRWKPADGEG